jgi:hypothetical protein
MGIIDGRKEFYIRLGTPGFLSFMHGRGNQLDDLTQTQGSTSSNKHVFTFMSKDDSIPLGQLISMILWTHQVQGNLVDQFCQRVCA